MENFKNNLEKKNITEMSIFLKNSPVDLLKSIAKRYKLSVSTKKKELIVSDILQAIKKDKAFAKEPPIHLMTISQLRNKAHELNIDYSSVKLKQDLRLAIIKKMQKTSMTTPPPTSSTSSSGTTTMDQTDDAFSFENLMGKTLTYLKALAKKYKIKVSKLSKKQLVTLIMEARASGIPDKSLDLDAQKDLSKLRKNELIVIVEQFGGQHKGKSKTELVDLIQRFRAGTYVVSTETEVLMEGVPEINTLPIDKKMEKELLENRKVTLAVIRKILGDHGIKIPKELSKRKEIIHLLTKAPKQSTPRQQETIERVTITPPPTTPKKSKSPQRKQAEVISQSSLEQAPKKPRRKTPTGSDIVSLDDIHSPFSPVPVQDLLEEPTEKQLQEELYRCLEFYEYPK